MIVKVLDNGVELPVHETELAAGIDLKITSFKKLFSGDREIPIDKLKYSIERGYFTLRGFERVLVGTNLFVELPDDTQLEIRARSSVALKRGLMVANSPGTIDADYRHEIGVIIYNSTPYLNKLYLDEKIAQAVLMPYIPIEWESVDKLSEPTNRIGGFGSTNK